MRSKHYRLEKRKEKIPPFYGIWEKSEEELPFPEYPRPQMRRENWTNLNGWWEYAFTETQKMPKQRDGKISVPFSPECDASGVKRQLLQKNICGTSARFSFQKFLPENGCCCSSAPWIRCGNLLQRKACRRPSRRVSFFFSVDLTPYLKTERTSLPSRCAMRRTRTEGPRKAEPYPGRHVLHRAERHLAERLDGMGAGDVSGTHRDHAGI